MQEEERLIRWIDRSPINLVAFLPCRKPLLRGLRAARKVAGAEEAAEVEAEAVVEVQPAPVPEARAQPPPEAVDWPIGSA